MKILEDIWSSMSGNARTKINDPFIGAFVASWVACNWNHLAILIWGDGKPSERINTLHTYLTDSPLLALNSILVLPALFAFLYVFIFPWLSLLFKSIQKAVNDRLHRQAINIELEKLRQQEDLNKLKLRSNPDKQFLTQMVQLDIDSKTEQLELLRIERFLSKERAEEATAKAAEAKGKANIVQLDEASKQRHAEIERERFNVNSAKVRAALASHRFPSAYRFMSLIEQSVKLDGVSLSLTATGEVVAAIFGYDNFQALIDDEKFNNISFSNVEYIYYESADLALKLEKVVLREKSENEDLTSDLLFDHVLTVFGDLPYKLLTKDDLEEICVSFFEDNRYAILEEEGVSGAIAESDTIFEEVELESVESVEFDDGINAVIDASARGSHRKDAEIPGRSMSISIEVKSTVQVGKYALGAFEFVEVNGSLDDFHEEDEDAR
ncbi:hypothetical protein F6476_22265 [Pseudomonas umsongensis]|uniref:hypothetical protein n=1 Tax=Pseudomonas umsongensis TaxID=198618 RepID=UPI0012464EF3|nr:hypothetical protein [Pseudomonas umsongensis]QFG31703.1 hypothetical protein F6476_22265 [Pseudomonas umsongensis]